MRLSLLWVLFVLTACGGSTPPRAGPATEPGARPDKPDPASAREAQKTRYLDEDCVVQANTMSVVLPRVLRSELTIEALTGDWEGSVYRGRGRIDVRIRKLRLLTEKIEIRLTDGPVANLRVTAEGDARISATTLAPVDHSVRLILLRPSAVLKE